MALILAATVTMGRDGAAEPGPAPTYSLGDCPHHIMHLDYASPMLDTNGGILLSSVGRPTEVCPDNPRSPYGATLTYPAGAPHVLADITERLPNESAPPSLRHIWLTMEFGTGPRVSGVLFKGASVFTFTYPKTIADGQTVKLALWSIDADFKIRYGDTLTATSKGVTASFAIHDLTLPPKGPYGMTLGE